MRARSRSLRISRSRSWRFASAAVQRALEIGRTHGEAEPEGIGLVRAAEAEARNSRDPEHATAAADRAERAAEAVKAALAKRQERDRLILQLRERARKAAHRAVDLLDRIDAEDVRYVEAARAAVIDADRATDLAVATAAVERAGQAVLAVKAAADRRSARGPA